MQQLLYIGVLILCLFIGQCIFYFVKYDDLQNTYFHFGLAMCIVLIITLGKHFNVNIQFYLQLILIIHNIYTAEQMKNEEYFTTNIIDGATCQHQKIEILKFGFDIAIFLLFTSGTSHNFIIIIFQLASIIYIIIRINIINEIILYLILLLLIIGLYFYLQQRNDRLNYYKSSQQTKKLSELKIFLNQIMPTPVFVISKLDRKQQQQHQQQNGNFGSQSIQLHQYSNLAITFYNEICFQEFNIKTKEEIISKVLIHQQFILDKPESCRDPLVLSQRFGQQMLIDDLIKDINSIQTNSRQSQSQNIFNQNGTYILLEEKNYFNCIFYNLDPENNTERHYDIKVMKCLWQNQPSLLAIFSNISSQVQNIKLKELDEYKNKLLASVTHDLKNPLNGIQTMLQSSQSLVSLKQIKYINSIALKNSNLLLSLINDILDYSQIMKGKLRLVPTKFSLHQLIQDVINLFQFTAQQKGIELKRLTNSNIEADWICYSDENRLKQILINLIGNALKFTYEGYITVEYMKSIDYDHCFEITITDTGVGIPDHIQPKLFSEYSTFDDNRGSNKFGIGLGLSICKKIVKQLGPSDKISLQSKVNKGSSFKFLIYKDINSNLEMLQCSLMNLKSQHNILQQELIMSNDIDNNYHNLLSSKVIEDEKDENIFNKNIEIMQSQRMFKQLDQIKNSFCSQSQQLQNQGKSTIIQNIDFDSDDYGKQIEELQKIFNIKSHILFVDDDSFNQFGFECMMQPIKNIVIIKALNGKQAIEQVLKAQKEQRQFTYILMDVNMPVMNGIDAIKEIRKLNNLGLIEKISIISLIGDQEDRKKCLLAGANAVLDKPLTYFDFINVLRKLIIYNNNLKL